jgi:hypothetical protein
MDSNSRVCSVVRAPDIEITLEMIRAGAAAYLDFDLRGGEIEDRIERVYLAMESVRRKKLSTACG